MRIKVNINEPDEVQDMATLQTWVEEHKDGERDFLTAVCPSRGALILEFSYDWVIGCHRFFIFDPISDELLSFFAEDFTDIGKWIFQRCNEYFGMDYTIVL